MWGCPATLRIASTSLRTRSAPSGIIAAMRRLAMVLTAALCPVARSLARRVTPNAPRPRTRPRVKTSVMGGGGGEEPSTLTTRKSSKGGGGGEREEEEDADAENEAAVTRLPQAEG